MVRLAGVMLLRGGAGWTRYQSMHVAAASLLRCAQVQIAGVGVGGAWHAAVSMGLVRPGAHVSLTPGCKP